MAVQLNIEFDDLVQLVDQLTPSAKRQLLLHLQAQPTNLPESQTWNDIFESAVVSVGSVSPDFSFRREDWY